MHGQLAANRQTLVILRFYDKEVPTALLVPKLLDVFLRREKETDSKWSSGQGDGLI